MQLSVLLAVSTSQSHLLSVASISLDTAVWKWYLLTVNSVDVGGCRSVQLQEVCVNPSGSCIWEPFCDMVSHAKP